MKPPSHRYQFGAPDQRARVAGSGDAASSADLFKPTGIPVQSPRGRSCNSVSPQYRPGINSPDHPVARANVSIAEIAKLRKKASELVDKVGFDQ